MATTHVAYIRFAGESGLEGILDEYAIGTMEHLGLKFIHTEHMPANFVAGNGMGYEYVSQVDDGENWIQVNAIIPIV